jgi:enamine deaminase RidA (YjgF/YER057c/UK114 family)
MDERILISSQSEFEALIGYSRAVVDGEWIFVAGTTGFDYRSGTISEDPVEQVEQCLRNIGDALGRADATFADIVRVRYILPDRRDFERCWPTLRRYLGKTLPAATMIQAGLIDERMKIEIEVTAKRRTT